MAIPSTTDFAAARQAMIDSQLRTSGINDPAVLKAMQRVAREDHVPETRRAAAYIDRAVPLDNGRFLAAPLFYGAAIEAARPAMSDRVLIVDAGSGYLPALLGPMLAEVETIDVEKAIGKGRKGGDYTLLFIDGAIEQFPDALGKRLADGARVVTGLVERGVTRLATGRKTAGQVAFQSRQDMAIPILEEFARAKEWAF